MQGFFRPGRFPRVMFVLSVLLGLCSIVLLFFAETTEEKKTAAAAIGSAFLCSCVMLPFMRRTTRWLKTDGDRLVYGGVLFGGWNCKISDIRYVLWQRGSITILLKNGKRRVLFGLVNARAVCEVLLRAMPYKAPKSEELVWEKLQQTVKARKSELYGTAAGVATMFVLVFLLVFLTGAKENFSEFTATDRIWAAVVGVAELLTVVFTFCMADKTGKKRLEIQRLLYILRRMKIDTKPLPAGNAQAAYTDDFRFRRVVIFGYPDSADVYYTIEEVDDFLELFVLHTSEVFESVDVLSEAMVDFVDITANFIKQKET